MRLNQIELEMVQEIFADFANKLEINLLIGGVSDTQIKAYELLYDKVIHILQGKDTH